MLLGLAVLAAAIGVAFVHFVFDRSSPQTVAQATPPPAPEPTPTPAPPPPPEPTPPPVAVVTPDAAAPEIEIDVPDVPDPTPPATPTTPRPPTTGTHPRPHPPVVAAVHADAGVATATTHPQTPADAAVAVVAATPEVPDGCDEVSCVLDKYARPCCEHFRPAAHGQAGTPDTLDRVMVRAGVQSVMPRVIACGEKIAAKGTVKIAMKVGADGHVTDVSVVDAPSPAIGTCVAAALHAATFGKSVNGVSFTYPFVF